jgi:hypothetical protein
VAAKRSITNLRVRGTAQFDREFTVKSIALKVHRIYRARVGGDPVAAPFVASYVNTLIGEPTVLRNSEGTYDFILPGAFILNKTFCRANSLNDGGLAVSYNFQALDGDENGVICRLQPLDVDGSPTDYFDASIEIDVYE